MNKCVTGGLLLAGLSTAALATEPIDMSMSLSNIQIMLDGASYDGGGSLHGTNVVKVQQSSGDQVFTDEKTSDPLPWTSPSHLQGAINTANTAGSTAIDFGANGIGNLSSKLTLNYNTHDSIDSLAGSTRYSGDGNNEARAIAVPAGSTLTVSADYALHWSFDTASLPSGWYSHSEVDAMLGLDYSNEEGGNDPYTQKIFESLDSDAFPHQVLSRDDSGHWTVSFTNTSTTTENVGLTMWTSLSANARAPFVPPPPPVPEPATLLLMAGGLLGLAATRRKRI